MKSILLSASENINQSFIYDNRYIYVLEGLKNTVLISLY